MRKGYLSRHDSRRASLDHPVGDATGGAAYGERNDPISAFAIGGANLAGAALSYDAAGDAADATENAAALTAEASLKAARSANKLTRFMYNRNRQDMKPWRQAGRQGLNRLLNLYGFRGEDKAADALELDPGYQFRLREGMGAIENSAAARGGMLSGNTARAIEGFGQDYASSEFSNVANRLAGLAGVGQSVTQNLGAAGMNAAGQIGGNTMNAAQLAGQSRMTAAEARGNAGIAQANAINNLIGSGTDMYTTNAMLKNNGYAGIF